MSADSLLLNWCIEQTKDYPQVLITNFTTSWKDGLAFCALIHKHAPDNIDFSVLRSEEALKNVSLAFSVAQKKFNVSPSLDPHSLVTVEVPDKQSIIDYISQLYLSLTGNTLCNLESISDLTQLRLSLMQIQGSESPKCDICGCSTYVLERLTVSDKIYHRSCYRNVQLNNLKERNNLLDQINNEESSKSVSSSNGSTNSPSPVRSPIQSPIASYTIQRNSNPPRTDNIEVVKRHAPPRPPLPKFLRKNVSNKTELSVIKNSMKLNDESKPNLPNHTSTDYPPSLNPFDDDFCNVSKEETPKECKSVYKTPFDDDDDDDDTGVGVVDEKMYDDTGKVANSMVYDCIPILDSSVTSNNATSTSIRMKVTGANSHALCQSLSVYHCDSASLVYPLSETLTRRSCQLSKYNRPRAIETRSAIFKRPAPPIPVPTKRNIRSESNEEFIPYTELHKRLFSFNKKLSSIEATARDLQEQIRQASPQSYDCKRMLDEWLEAVHQKDILFQKESELLNKLRCQELDDRHAELEHELRMLFAKQDILKTKEEKLREKELLADLVHTVDKRAEIVDSIDKETTSPRKMSPRKKFKNKLKKMISSTREWQSKYHTMKFHYPLVFKLNRPTRDGSRFGGRNGATLSCLNI